MLEAGEIPALCRNGDSPIQQGKFSSRAGEILNMLSNLISASGQGFLI